MNAGQSTRKRRAATLLIDFDWDSGPYGLYYESEKAEPELERPNGYGRETIPIPKAVWRRYDRAREALQEAEEALEEAKVAARDVLRQFDPRWNTL